MKHRGQAQLSLHAWPLMMQVSARVSVSGSILPVQVAGNYKNDIPNADTELRRHQTTHGGTQQRKGCKNSLAAFWIFTEPRERTQFRVIHLVMVVGGTAKF